MNHDQFYVRHDYERLILSQPQIQFEGLWVKDQKYFILCPMLDSSTKTKEGDALIDWFNNSCKVIGSPTQLVSYIPDDAIPVPIRTAEEVALQRGEPLKIDDLFLELSNSLPLSFPLLQLKSVSLGSSKIEVQVSRELNEDERIELDITLENIGELPEYTISVKSEEVTKKQIEDRANFAKKYKQSDNLSLLPSRRLPANVPSSVRETYQQDAEFWIDNRGGLFNGNELTKEHVLPSEFRSKNSTCLIDATAFPPDNLRVYLPLYQRIVIAMPLKESFDQALLKFNVSRKELIELISKGRVQFILPQPIQRYDVDFIADILNTNPHAVLFSRRLSIASVLETRSRVPFLYPTVGAEEKLALIRAFMSVKEPELRKTFQIIGYKLSQIWIGMEKNINARGAMGNMGHGVGPILDGLFSSLKGEDYGLKLVMNSMAVEWSAALNATLFPFESPDYSNYGAAAVCASMYSGIRKDSVNPVNQIKEFQPLVNGLLTLDNDAPILEVESVFSHRDIDQLHNLLHKQKTNDDIQLLIQEMNEKVKHYEKESSRLKRIDVAGLIGALPSTGLGIASMASGSLVSGGAAVAFIPLGIWLANYVFNNADPSIDFGGRALDWVRGVNANSSADTVLLSRIQGKLSTIK